MTSSSGNWCSVTLIGPEVHIFSFKSESLILITLRDADKHGAVVVGVLHQDQQGLADEVVLPQVSVSQCEQQTVLPRSLETSHLT